MRIFSSHYTYYIIFYFRLNVLLRVYYLYYLQLFIFHPPFLPRLLLLGCSFLFTCTSHRKKVFVAHPFYVVHLFLSFFLLKRFNINTHTGALVETYVYLELVSSFSRTVTLFLFP